jgi:hypothetical protein
MVPTHEVQGEIEVDARWGNKNGVSCVHIAWKRTTRRVGNGVMAGVSTCCSYESACACCLAVLIVGYAVLTHN